MPLPAAIGYAAIGVVGALVALIHQGPQGFVPGVCERLEPYLASQLVGQELALRQLADAVCDHAAGKQTPAQKPLVLSVHGPPGVGKSLAHLLLARALYNPGPAAAGLQCPGPDCPGYRVLYGMDYTASERAAQHDLLRASVLEHLGRHPDALLVVEEYDKLDCPTRGFLRQLLERGHGGNVTTDRTIVVLESNTGYLELLELLAAAGDRAKVSAEGAQRVLKDLMFSAWRGGGVEGGASFGADVDSAEEEGDSGYRAAAAGRADGCREARADTLKMLALVDFYLPFLPLERRHIEQLFEMRLEERRQALLAAPQPADLTWDAGVVRFLTDRVDFDGDYPIEGAKEVATLMTRYVSRALRPWTLPRAVEGGGKRRAQLAAVGSKLQGLLPLKGHAKRMNETGAVAPPLPTVKLRVEADRAGLGQITAQELP